MINNTDINPFPFFSEEIFSKHVYIAKQFLQDDNDVILPQSVPLKLFQQIYD